MSALKNPLEPYYTIRVPFLPYPIETTKWHPTDSSGPFSVLTRGVFATLAEAVAWGRANLNGTPYSIDRIDADSAASENLF